MKMLIHQRIKKIKKQSFALSVSNLHLNLKFECNCSSGYFWNQNSCSQCYQSCLTCIDNQFNCLSCEQSLHRILDNNKCVCAQNYFESENRICISCSDQLGKSQESCKYQDCKDLIWTYGEECDDGNNVQQLRKISLLQIETVVLIVRLIITTLCCNKILKQSIFFQCSTNCIQCLLIPYTNKSQCIKCKAGYFLNKNDCVLCSINCLECIDNAYNCISCKFPQQNNHKCQFCKSGYYADEINGFCHNKCGDYIKINEEECDDGNLIQGDGCDDQCKLEKKFIFLNGVSINRLKIYIISYQIIQSHYYRVKALLRFILLSDYLNYPTPLKLLQQMFFNQRLSILTYFKQSWRLISKSILETHTRYLDQ